MKQRVDEFYAMRGISICGIVLLHVTAFFLFSENEGQRVFDLSLMLNQVARIFLPMFIVITGFGLAYNYNSSTSKDKPFSASKFLKKRIMALLTPYALWSLLYFLFYIFVLNQIPAGGKVSALDSIEIDVISTVAVFTKNLLFGWNYVHLYYVILLFQFYIIYALLIKNFVKISFYKQKLLLAINVVIYSLLVIYLAEYRHLTGNFYFDIFVRYYWEICISWYIYFLLGVMIGLHFQLFLKITEKHFSKMLLAYLVTLSLVLIESFYFNDKGTGNLTSLRITVFLNTIPALFFYFKVCRFIKGSATKLFTQLKKIGEMSFGIYLIHPMLIVVISNILHKVLPEIFGFGRTSFLVVLFGATLAGSLFFVWSVNRIPAIGVHLTGLKPIILLSPEGRGKQHEHSI